MNQPSTRHAPISGGLLESIARCISSNITHREATKYLAECSLSDVSPSMSLWMRLYNSFVQRQNQCQYSNDIRVFIQKVCAPGRFISDPERFERFRVDVNRCILLLGLELSESGKYRLVEKATTIKEAHARAQHLETKLKERNVHPTVLLFCKAELVDSNYFHAVLECTKSIADKIRALSGSGKDGTELIELAFGLPKDGSLPIVALNRLVSESEKSEHKGFANLMKGFLGMFRNTTAHAPRIAWNMPEEEALDCLTMASMIYRKLESCTVATR